MMEVILKILEAFSMKQLQPIIIIVAIFLVLTFLLPTLLVTPTISSSKEEPQTKKEALKEKEEVTEVAVFRYATNEIETIPLEEYVTGVVASEMPAEFELEALKAQALTARTYILNQLLHGDKTSLPEGADITDTTAHQVYKNKEEVSKIKGWKKIHQAVEETAGEILTYDGKPITAAFFSTSNGYTENAEEYWQNQIPYLKSVESPWDKHAPTFEVQTKIPLNEFQQKLGITLTGDELGEIKKRTTGKKIAQIELAGKTFTGREIREKLNLRSTDFTWEQKGNEIMITTRGYGHGVGMSQYGANGMAKEGKDYRDIVTHYYKDIEIVRADDILDDGKYVLKE